MWPWEHLAVGYLIYSAYARTRTDRPPDDLPALLLAVSTQFPDLIDKPLAWTFGVLPNGTSVGHSIFVAGAVSLLATRLDAKARPMRYAPAVAIGYVSHLVGDAIYPVLEGSGSFAPAVMLWPVVTGPDKAPSGFVVEFEELFVSFLHFLGTPLGRIYFAMEVLLVGGAVLVWILDGAPGFSFVVRPFRKAIASE